MRSTSMILALASLLVTLLALVSAQNPADPVHYAKLEKRQAAAGGGAGVATTYTGVQTISGYTPPPSSIYPTPTVSAGTILSSISGYNMTSSTAGAASGNLGSSSGAMSLLRTPQFTIIATGMVTFFCVAFVAALGLAF